MTKMRGFTIIELMISLVLFTLVVAGILSVAVSMSNGMREQRAAVEAEASARTALTAISQALRQVSPGVSSGNIQDAATCASGALTVTNSSTGPDQLDVIYAAGGVVTSTTSVYGTGTTSLTVGDASQLSVNDYIVISNTTQGHFVQITGISGSTLTLASQCSGISLPTGGYPMRSLVIRAQHVKFSIGSVDGIPTMMMDPDSGGSAAAQPYAEGVEDLQVAIGVDVNGDGAVTEVGAAANDDEWQGNKSGDTALSGPIRALRITVVARADQALSGSAAPFNLPAAEDRPAGTAFDAYRRRVLRSTIEIRNLTGSP